MEKLDPKTFGMISRWANLELVYKGKSYYIVPDILYRFSDYLSKNRNSIHRILIPDVDGPFDEFIDSLYVGGFKITRENAEFCYGLGSALGIKAFITQSENLVMNMRIEELAFLGSKLSKVGILDEILIDKIARNFNTALETNEIRYSTVEFMTRIRDSQFFTLTNPVVYGQYLVSRYEENHDFESLLRRHITDSIAIKDFSIFPPILKLEGFDLSEYSDAIDEYNAKFNGPEEIYQFNPNDPLEGFFAAKRNFSENGAGDFVILRSSSQFNNKFTPYKLIDGNNQTYYCSKDGSSVKEYVEVILKQGRMRLDTYVMSGHWNRGSCVGPTKWIVTASCDDIDWVTIDERNETSIVNTEGPVQFVCSNPNGYYTHFKFLQLDNNGSNNKRFILGNLELFGSYEK